MQVQFSRDTDERANLTEFVTVVGFNRYNFERRQSQVVVSMPSQAFKRQDGSLTIQARLSNGTVTGIRPAAYVWMGIRADATAVTLNF